MRRSGDCQLKRLSNCLHDESHILVHFVIPEANHPIAAGVEPCGPSLVMRGSRLFEMLRAVEFHDESLRKADEVDDVGTECSLSAELVPVELRSAQEEPQVLLSARGHAAEPAGKVSLLVVTVHCATL